MLGRPRSDDRRVGPQRKAFHAHILARSQGDLQCALHFNAGRGAGLRWKGRHGKAEVRVRPCADRLGHLFRRRGARRVDAVDFK